MTESIQVLPMDDEETENDNVQTQDEMETMLTPPQPALNVLIKQEFAQEDIQNNEISEVHSVNEDTEDELHVSEEEQLTHFENEFSEEVVDSKSGDYIL